MALRSTGAHSRLTTSAGCDGRHLPPGGSLLHHWLLPVVGPATVLAVLLAAEWSEGAPARFYAVTPCRVADTRTATNAPALAAGSTRSFTVAGVCGTSPTASAVAVNVTVTGSTAGGHIRLFPKGQSLPGSSAINYSGGQTRANNATVAVGADGALSVFGGQPAGSVHVILDVSGYFDDPANNQPPAVTAGPNQTITLPASASLTGTATDDGKPSGTLTYAWSKVSGPGGVTFSAPGSLTTSASFASSGTYVVRFSASDSLLSGSADVTVEARQSSGRAPHGRPVPLGTGGLCRDRVAQRLRSRGPLPAVLAPVHGPRRRVSGGREQRVQWRGWRVRLLHPDHHRYRTVAGGPGGHLRCQQHTQRSRREPLGLPGAPHRRVPADHELAVHGLPGHRSALSTSSRRRPASGGRVSGSGTRRSPSPRSR